MVAQKKSAPDQVIGPGRIDGKDSGDNRLSRQRHYHGPGGLNGRVRNGNGCDHLGKFTGKLPEYQ